MAQSNIRTIETKIIGVREEGETGMPCLLVDVEVPEKTELDSILLSYNTWNKLQESLEAGIPREMVGREVTVKYNGSKLVDIYKKC